MEGRGQWEVVLYNPAEKQTVLYNGYDHTLRILDGGASVHGSILMPAPPRRTSIDYVPNKYLSPPPSNGLEKPTAPPLPKS